MSALAIEEKYSICAIEQDSICGVCHRAHVPYVAVLPGSTRTVCRECLVALGRAVDTAEIGEAAKANGPALLGALEALARVADGHLCDRGDSEMYDAVENAKAVIKKTRGAL